MRRLFLSITFALSLCGLLAQQASAQPGALFGKNKVQYKNFNWKFIQSPHFDVYFYPGGQSLAEFCAEHAETALVSIEKTIKYDITNRISILVYNSHNDFQQTNAVSEFLPEGVGGVTELFKNRVILPFEGNYGLFRHVIHHELVHAVLNDMFTGGTYQSLLTGGGMMIPTWMNEGLAEYESLHGLDIETDMFMRDATLNDAVPPLERLGGYVQYRVGQTMYWYIAQKYGPEKVGELLQRIKATHDIPRGFQTTFGLTIPEFGDKFIEALKVLYFPDIARYEDPNNFAEALADHKKLENFINSGPQVSPQGDLVAYISDRYDYYDVFVQSLARPKEIKRVLKGGGATANFEELHLLAPGISWSPDGKKIALAAKAGERDNVFIIDVNTEDYQPIGRLNLDGIQQVAWSPDGKKLAIIGVNSGESDVYLYDIASEHVDNLTKDFFADRDPVWSGDGQSIYFISERDAYLKPGEYHASAPLALNFKAQSRDVYRFNFSDSSITRVTNTPENELSPALTKDGKTLYYISDKNGINNIWTAGPLGESARPLTNSVSKIDQISISNDGTKLVFSSMHKGGYDVYLLRNPSDRHMDTLALTEFRKQTGGLATRMDTLANTRLRKDLSDTAKGYGSVGVDLHDYVFSDNPESERSARDFRMPVNTPVQTVTNFKDTTGHYLVHDYKVVFTPDVIIGSAGYTGYYGLQGTTQMLFSDELGNHQIFFATNLILDLRNSDYVLAYYNFQNRMNWGLQGIHTARFINILDENNFVLPARFTSSSVSGIVSYPFSRFKRFDANITGLVLTKDIINQDTSPTLLRYAVYPQLAYVHDDVLWSYFYPRAGTRYNLSIAASPKIGNNWLGFVTPSLDFRHYFKLTSDISFATRFAGALSFGPTPQRFFLGGVEGWLNQIFSPQVYPLNQPEDFAFFTTGQPLRGYPRDEKIGTKYVLANLELRYPFPIFVAGFPLAFFGDMFVDAGTAWNQKVYFFQKSPTGAITTKDLLLSTGTGVRTYLFGFYVHADIAWRTNLKLWSRPNYIISIGEDF